MASVDEEAAQIDCGYWATIKNKIHLQKGDYSFEDREYLREPMSSVFRRRCYMKSAQGGGSLAEILKSLHGMIYNYLPTGVLYLFPSDKDMQDYSKGVMNPIIMANPCIKNAASLKSINGANLYLRGAGLSQIIEGEGESGALKGISVDKVVFDEIELMDELAIAKAIARMNNSSVKEEVYIGNPGIPGRGIDKVFSLSDQRHWFRTCRHCKARTCAELYFMEDAEKCVGIRDDGTGFIRCSNCGKEVLAGDGEWVAAERHKSDYMHGYRWSCLTSPNNDPVDILHAYRHPPQDNLSDVYRLKLGLAHTPAETMLVTSQVFARCGPDAMEVSDYGPCAFGLDVGKTCHLVIGKRIARDRYEIVKIARLPGDGDWNEISRMVRQFNCKSGVIDVRPYESAARRFQKAHKMLIFLCEYSDSTALSRKYDKKTGLVKVNRTEIFDDTYALVADPHRLTIPHISPEIRVFADQLCNPAKRFDEKKGVYRYVSLKSSDSAKGDHYRNALNYFLLAADKIGVCPTKGEFDWTARPKKYTKVMNNYARI
jgi:hypothetical protein